MAQRLDHRLTKLEAHKPDVEESLDGLSASEAWKRVCDQGRRTTGRNEPAMTAAEAWQVVSAALADDEP